jgi:hypothetical protein
MPLLSPVEDGDMPAENARSYVYKPVWPHVFRSKLPAVPILSTGVFGMRR